MVITHSLAQIETTNAVLVWGLLAVVLLAVVLSVLTHAVLWGVFAVTAIALIALPTILSRYFTFHGFLPNRKTPKKFRTCALGGH